MACSGSDTPDAGTFPDSGVATDTGVTPDTGVEETDAGFPDSGEEPDAGPATCLLTDPVDTTPDPGCTEAWVASVRGELRHGDAAPFEDGRAQVCVRGQAGAALSCLRPVASCPDGQWEFLVPDNLRCVEELVMHNYALGGLFADTYCRPDPSTLDARALLDPVTIYATTAPANLPPRGTGSEARTITFSDGVEVDVTPDGTFFDLGEGDDYLRLGMVKLPAAPNPAPCFLGAGDDFDAVYGFSPSLNVAGDTGFPFRISGTGIAQGTTVDLYVLGGLECLLSADVNDRVEEGHWALFATVTAGANGELASNLPCLNWLAYKAR
ncbi:MAG: hypothetical protein H6730_31820 [Deltaproteobacteria bacterium]|nr:hypothetical protein [Deltaproteobacteria bacterium]